jgi:type IV fimbrial biogenesis protein FimT
MKTSDKRIGMNMSKPKAGCIRPAHAAGFTTIELMITLALAAIVTVLAVPSFRYVTNSNRIAAEINGLLGDLQFARAEAIKEGRFATVCVSNDGLTCLNSTAWQNGWIVFSDPAGTGNPAGNTILRRQKTFSGTDTFAASNGLSLVTFNREGYAGGIAAGQILTLHDSTANVAWTRCLTLNLVGQMTTEKAGGACI